MLGEDETAAIDLSVGFFAAVLVAFIFAAFSAAPDAPPVPVTSIGQTAETVEVLPATWSPVRERGGFAIVSGGIVTMLDLGALAREIVAAPPGTAGGEDGHASFHAGQGAAPNEFAVNLVFTPGALPAAWVREVTPLGAGAPCPGSVRRLLTAWVDQREPSIAPLLSWASACRIRLRVEVLPAAAESGRVSRAIALDAGSFAAQRIFR